MNVTFITSNQHKADLFAEYMGRDIQHKKLDLDEIQSLQLREVVEHKVKEAFAVIKEPTLVEDVALTLNVLKGLPGPFVKWFEKTIGLEGICRLLDNYSDRGAKVSVCYGYFDGNNLHFFEGEVEGTITTDVRKGPSGFGWNPIFQPNGYDKTYAEMTENEQARAGLRATTVYPRLKEFLAGLDKA
ncbi:MAG TPA: non-canonical purine NTP pyrophosphatase [Candidatus Saccharimonadales bacterium]|nr:non-canonical purine NTP pyrophosphatase [Candidatus Saccharimonadales bacterium]